MTIGTWEDRRGCELSYRLVLYPQLSPEVAIGSKVERFGSSMLEDVRGWLSENAKSQKPSAKANRCEEVRLTRSPTPYREGLTLGRCNPGWDTPTWRQPCATCGARREGASAVGLIP
jgi:hypothetical protein